MTAKKNSRSWEVDGHMLINSASHRKLQAKLVVAREASSFVLQKPHKVQELETSGHSTNEVHVRLEPEGCSCLQKENEDFCLSECKHCIQ